MTRRRRKIHLKRSFLRCMLAITKTEAIEKSYMANKRRIMTDFVRFFMLLRAMATAWRRTKA